MFFIQTHRELINSQHYPFTDPLLFLCHLPHLSFLFLFLGESHGFSLLPFLFLNFFFFCSFCSLSLLSFQSGFGLLFGCSLCCKLLFSLSFFLLGFFFSFCCSLLLSEHVGLCLLNFEKLLLFFFIILLLEDSLLFELYRLFGLHLLFNFQHMELRLCLPSGKLMLSLETCEISFGCGLLRSGSFGFLISLRCQELLLHALCFKFLSRLFFLESLELSRPRLGKGLLLLPFLLGLSYLILKFFILFYLGQSLLFFLIELLNQC